MAWALISQTDHSAAGCTVAADGLSGTMSSGHLRLDLTATSGKRQIDCVNNGGGIGKIVTSLCLPCPIDDAINDANHWTYDGTGYFGHAGWDGGGHASLADNDVVSVLADLDLGTITFNKNGVLIGGFVGLGAGVYTVMFGCSTAIANVGITIISDPALFRYPASGFTGFGSAPPAAGGNFLAMI